MKLFETFHRSWSNLGKFFPSEFVSNQGPLPSCKETEKSKELISRKKKHSNFGYFHPNFGQAKVLSKN